MKDLKERIAWAGWALDEHSAASGHDQNGRNIQVRELLLDLMLWCEENDVSFTNAHDHATHLYHKG